MKPKPPADLWQQMDNLLGDTRLTIPEGAYTVRKFAAHYNIGEAKARAQLNRMTAQGKLKRGRTTKDIYYLPT